MLVIKVFVASLSLRVGKQSLFPGIRRPEFANVLIVTSAVAVRTDDWRIFTQLVFSISMPNSLGFGARGSTLLNNWLVNALAVQPFGYQPCVSRF